MELNMADHVLKARTKQLKFLVEHYPDLFTENTEFTCDKCAANDKCHWAFDGYCTGGDCLADK